MFVVVVVVLVSYFLIFPLTFRFLGTYQVSGDIADLITLDSYISTLVLMCIVLDIPIFSWLFAKLGFLSADFMHRYRKHAIVTILIVAAILTPTSDVFTLSLVALPMWLLYEVSIQKVFSFFEGEITPDPLCYRTGGSGRTIRVTL